MKRIGHKLGIACLLLMGALSLSSCASPQAASSTPDDAAEQEKEPVVHEVLRDQLIATLNLSRQPTDYITVSDSLDESAVFLADIALDDASLYAVSDGSRILENTLGNFTYAYLYDGSLSSAQVGRSALDTLQGKSLSTENSQQEQAAAMGKNAAVQTDPDRSLSDHLDEMDQKIGGLSVAWGENTYRSVWVLLVQAGEPYH